jgi:hypothetical protein
VQKILGKKYGSKVITSFVDQMHWWKLNEKCLVAVHVPGARNDMLDRGQLELMGLGVCVLSPEIVTVIGRHQVLEPFKHYVPVDPNYSNICEQIEWCRNHRRDCVEIGLNARLLFDSIVPPIEYWRYVKEILYG